MQPKRAFTLVEVVVVLAIVLILYSLVMPAVFSARLRGKETVCVSNLRQTWLALQMYQQDYEKLPVDGGHITDNLVRGGYVTASEIFVCPLEYRDLSKMDESTNPFKAKYPSSYMWPFVLSNDDFFKQKGEQAPYIICGVHTVITSSIPFYYVMRRGGNLNRVPASKVTNTNQL